VSEILKQNQAASHKKAVVFCADRNVVRFAQFVASQMIKAEPEPDFDIVIVTFDKSLFDLETPTAKVRICQIGEGPFLHLTASKQVPLTAYILMALPKVFSDDYDQIAYLDADVFLNSGKISDIFAAANPDFAISGVQDITQWMPTPFGPKTRYWEKLGIDQKPYLNTGVLVLDVQKCNQEGFFEGSLKAATKLARLKKDHPEIIFLNDQSAINMHLKGNWAPMSLRWNWQTSQEVARIARHNDPFIVHFIAQSKPWLNKPVPYTKQYLWVYNNFFENILQEEMPRPSASTANNLSLAQWMARYLTLHNLSLWLNVINPFYYTPLRGLVPMFQLHRNIAKIERAIAAGLPVWPDHKMNDALKKTGRK